MGDPIVYSKNNTLPGNDVANRRKDIEFVQENFNVKNTVEQLHKMMSEVTKDEINPRTVNAACNCVHALNQTIDMTIKAARFLNEK